MAAASVRSGFLLVCLLGAFSRAVSFSAGRPPFDGMYQPQYNPYQQPAAYNQAPDNAWHQTAHSGANQFHSSEPVSGDIYQSINSGANSVDTQGDFSGDIYQAANQGVNDISQIVSEARKRKQPVNVYMAANQGPEDQHGPGAGASQGRQDSPYRQVSQITQKGNNSVRKKQYSGDQMDYQQLTSLGSNSLILTRSQPM